MINTMNENVEGLLIFPLPYIQVKKLTKLSLYILWTSSCWLILFHFKMIPFSFLSKMRPYEVEVHGVKVEVSVASCNAHFIEDKVSELMTSLQRRIMGLSLYITLNGYPLMLVLCAEGRCLIITQHQKMFLEVHSDGF